MDCPNLLSGYKTPNKTRKEIQSDCLKKCFSSIINRKQVNLELNILRIILCKQLKINLKSLETGLNKILPYILVYHINNWSGWKKSSEYYKGNLTFKTWYEEFIKFLGQKLDEAINKHYVEVCDAQNKTRIQTNYKENKIEDRGSQTDNNIPQKALAPFSIRITGTPDLLNTIVFTDSSEKDIVLKPHEALEWNAMDLKCINIKEILSWPHVGVQMSSPILSFSRKNVHKYHRIMSFVGNNLLPSSPEDFIEHIDIVNENQRRVCFTVDYVKELGSEFLKILRALYMVPVVIPITLDLFQVLIQEFLTDIEELQVLRDGKSTIASNTSVLFNIGKCTYFRNKMLIKPVGTSRQDVRYTEIITPRMETVVMQIGGEAQVQSYLGQLNNVNNKSQVEPYFLPTITFSCVFCEVNFENPQLLVKHIVELHKMEPPIRCALCRRAFGSVQLAKNRWSHECSRMV